MYGDPIQAALVRINMGEIPKELLKLAFAPKRYDPLRKERYADNVSAAETDEAIRSLIVHGRVHPDISLVSGTEVNLPLFLAQKEFVDPWNVVYRFGREATGGRVITMVHEVMYGQTQTMSGNLGSAFNVGASTMLQAGRDVMRATTGMQTLSTAYCQIIGVNTILVNDINQLVGTAAIKVILGHEMNFNNIPRPYWVDVTDIVVLAVKAYIYNQLIIELDEGALRFGMALNRIREVFDSYADSNTLYMEAVKKYHKIGLLQDPVTKRKIMKLALGSKPMY